MNVCRFRITPLTPVHIGDGDVWYPYEYTVADGRLYHFDLPRLVESFNAQQREQVLEILNLDDAEAMMLRLRRFVSEQFKWIRETSEPIVPASARAGDFIRDRWNDAQNTHELAVAPTMRSNSFPILPGSSIKGILRTAMLYHLVSPQTTIRNNNELQQLLSGGSNRVQDDWWRFLKVGDAENLDAQGEAITKITVMERFTRGDAGSAGNATMPQLIEVLNPESFTFSHRIIVDDKAQERMFGKKVFTLNDVIQACRAFGKRHWQGESVFFGGVQDEVAQTTTAFYQRAFTIPRGFILRLGYGSGLDASTIRYKRQNASPDGETLPSKAELERESRKVSPDERALYTPRTRVLAEGMPLGWVRVEVVVEDSNSDLDTSDQSLAAPRAAAPASATKLTKTRREDAGTGARLEDLAKKFQKDKPQGNPKKKRDAGEKARREQEEIMRRLRRGN